MSFGRLFIPISGLFFVLYQSQPPLFIGARKKFLGNGIAVFSNFAEPLSVVIVGHGGAP